MTTIFALIGAVSCSQSVAPESATLVIKDARVWTGNSEQPWAQALASQGDTIIAVGSYADVEALIGDDTEVISVPGGMLVPGFIDTHVHFITGGAGLASVQLRDAATPDEFAARIGEFARAVGPGEWIMFGDWDHTLWGGELPRRDWIDDLTPDNPVLVNRLDGHMALANTAALELAGVDAGTQEVEGGTIVRYGAARPTGILKDNAMMLVEEVIPQATSERLDREARAAMAYVAANGVTTVHDMRAWISGADAAGLQVLVHAIGDSAIRDLLDIYNDVVETNGERDRRFRMEHAQHIAPDDIQRFAAQDVIASMQPYHAIDDGRWAEKVIGPERAQTTYAFRSLMDAGARVTFGSDWFVAPATPIEGIYAAVTRRTLDDANPDGWIPAQKISVEQALHAYTTAAAYASFDEGIKGMLKPGMLADFVLLDRDLTDIPPETIRATQILMTVVGGKAVYRTK